MRNVLKRYHFLDSPPVRLTLVSSRRITAKRRTSSPSPCIGAAIPNGFTRCKHACMTYIESKEHASTGKRKVKGKILHRQPETSPPTPWHLAERSTTALHPLVSRTVVPHHQFLPSSRRSLAARSSRSSGEPEWPLRVIIVGHNPSEKAWELGHYYGNPSNRMYKLLSTAGIIPPDFTASNDGDCPITSGVGFTDVVRVI